MLCFIHQSIKGELMLLICKWFMLSASDLGQISHQSLLKSGSGRGSVLTLTLDQMTVCYVKRFARGDEPRDKRSQVGKAESESPNWQNI